MAACAPFSVHNFISAIQICFSVFLVEWRCAPSFTPRQTSLDQRENPESFWDYTRKLGVGTAWDLTRITLDEMEWVRLSSSFEQVAETF
jgi:hypothetical protein